MEYLGLYNKPTAVVQPERKTTGPTKKKKTKKKKKKEKNKKKKKRKKKKKKEIRQRGERPGSVRATSLKRGGLSLFHVFLQALRPTKSLKVQIQWSQLLYQL